MSRSPELHQRQAERYARRRAAVERQISIIAAVRLIAFLVAAAFGFAAVYDREPWLYGPVAAAGLAAFAVAVWMHRRPYALKPRLVALEKVHRAAAARLDGRWAELDDTGAEFLDEGRPDLGELQVFGVGSLYQLIGRVRTPLARRRLARALSEGESLDDIAARQQAAAELAPLTTFRHRLEAEALSVGVDEAQLDRFLTWAEASPAPSWLDKVRWLPWVTVPATWVLLTLALSFDLQVPWQVPVVLQCIIYGATTLKLGGWYGDLVADEKYQPFVALGRLFRLVERRRFTDPQLVDLQRRLANTEGGKAVQPSQAVARLEGIIAGLASRQNALMFFVFNVLGLWEIIYAHRLERWRSEHGRMLRGRLEVLADLEAIAALGGFAWDHPEYCRPTVKAEGTPVFEATAMGHPLIPAKVRRCNDFTMPSGGRLVLITGSNMSGKSSFLRTVGVNALLARAAAVCCAESLQVVAPSASTSIQVTDAPELGLSLFYAEVKRIKRILDEVQGAQEDGARAPRLYLVDEMLRGTNSKERNLATLAVARSLLAATRSYGLITTHDLSLVRLAEQFPDRVEVYHFTDRVEGKALQFDYRLRRGVSTTTNALDLLRAEGIDVAEDDPLAGEG
ncbi:MAG: MutS-related protein [Bradymonadia bacterium]